MSANALALSSPPIQDSSISIEDQQTTPPPSSYPRPPRALPPPPRRVSRVIFEPSANRRYSSAPHPLRISTVHDPAATSGIIKQPNTRHTSLFLDERSSVRVGYMPQGRPRGESDLSRPSQIRGSGKRENGHGFSTIAEGSGSYGDKHGVVIKHALPTELLTSILLPLPYLLSSLLNAPETRANHAAHSTNLEAAEEILEEVASTALPVPTSSSSLIHACALTAGTLLLVGVIGRILHATTTAEGRKQQEAQTAPHASRILSGTSLRRLLLRMVNVGLPFLATVEIGGIRTGMILLCAVSAGLIAPDTRADETNVKTWKRALYTRQWTCVLFVLSLLADVLWLRTDAEPANLVRGYVALGKAVLFLQPPLPTGLAKVSKMTSALVRSNSLTSVARAGPVDITTDLGSLVSPLVCTDQDINFTLAAGAVLGLATILFSALLNVAPSISYSALATFSASIGSAAGLYFLAQPLALRSRNMVGLATGLGVCAAFGLVFGLHSPLSGPALVGAAILSYFALRLDLGRGLWSKASNKPHDHVTYVKKAHEQEHAPVTASRATQFFLRWTENNPVVHSILLDGESRHIVYFMFINLTFMFVQGVYAYLSGSLGLFSDTIHMFFDCAGLLVGLIAAVMSKWPPTVKFPYGYGKIETLSGLGNGIFLVFVSIEIIVESFERFMEGVELQRVTELIIVSIGGLAVNLIGLKFIGHAHHGHGHDHGHGHGHGHDHGHSHSHVHDGSHDHDHVHHSAAGKAGHNRTTSLSLHHEGHANENMYGIYLHIMADTMGSGAVIISSMLYAWNGWSGWDPIASCIIAILIIAASYPLVMGSAKRLLISVPSDTEWRIRNALGEVSAIKGVAGYAVPRFWLEESAAHDEEAGHGHSHDHGHTHNHDADCDHGHSHSVARKVSHARLPSHDENDEYEEAPHTHTYPHDRHDHDHSHSHDHHDSSGHSHGHNHSHDHSPNAQAHSRSHSPAPALLPSPAMIPITPLTPNTMSNPSTADRINGVIHIIAVASADMEDVRKRVEQFLKEKNMDVLVHVDREGAGRCWCKGDAVAVGDWGRRGSVMM